MRGRSNINFSRYALAAATVGVIGAAEKSSADFIPPYALNPPPNNTFNGASVNGVFGNWTSSITYAPTSGGDSLVTNQPASVALNITDFQFPSPGTDNFDLVATAIGSGTVSFDWNLSSISSFSALTLGYLVNGSFTQIANSTSSGSASFSVTAGNVFGFRLVANYGSQGGVTISNFSAPIPEPSVTMLAVTGAVGLIAMRAFRRRKLARS